MTKSALPGLFPYHYRMLEMESMLDGYRILRRIGSGGFGDVFLCRNEAVGDFRALKFIPASSPDLATKELQALVRFRAAVAQFELRSILPIEHVRQTESGLFYVMPLSDGWGGEEPADLSWKPWTLEEAIALRRTAPVWFSTEEIRAFLLPILDALQGLSDAGLVHRDVKPANVLKFSGKITLADISLLGPDSAEITRRGTPGYVAPSWFLEAGGHPDMYGIGTTLYTLLTGNPPDKMGRSAFWNPPQGTASFSPEEVEERKRLRDLVMWVTEKPAKNPFHNFHVLADALQAKKESAGPEAGAIDNTIRIIDPNHASEQGTEPTYRLFFSSQRNPNHASEQGIEPTGYAVRIIDSETDSEQEPERGPGKVDGYAIASFFLALFCFVPLIGFIAFIPAIIFGHISLKRGRTQAVPKARLLAIIGLAICFCYSMVIIISVAIIYLRVP